MPFVGTGFSVGKPPTDFCEGDAELGCKVTAHTHIPVVDFEQAMQLHLPNTILGHGQFFHPLGWHSQSAHGVRCSLRSHPLLFFASPFQFFPHALLFFLLLSFPFNKACWFSLSFWPVHVGLLQSFFCPGPCALSLSQCTTQWNLVVSFCRIFVLWGSGYPSGSGQSPNGSKFCNCQRLVSDLLAWFLATEVSLRVTPYRCAKSDVFVYIYIYQTSHTSPTLVEFIRGIDAVGPPGVCVRDES